MFDCMDCDAADGQDRLPERLGRALAGHGDWPATDGREYFDVEPTIAVRRPRARARAARGPCSLFYHH